MWFSQFGLPNFYKCDQFVQMNILYTTTSMRTLVFHFVFLGLSLSFLKRTYGTQHPQKEFCNSVFCGYFFLLLIMIIQGLEVLLFSVVDQVDNALSNIRKHNF